LLLSLLFSSLLSLLSLLLLSSVVVVVSVVVTFGITQDAILYQLIIHLLLLNYS